MEPNGLCNQVATEKLVGWPQQNATVTSESPELQPPCHTALARSCQCMKSSRHGIASIGGAMLEAHVHHRVCESVSVTQPVSRAECASSTGGHVFFSVHSRSVLEQLTSQMQEQSHFLL